MKSDLEAITFELWSAVSDLATIVERLTEADDDDMTPVRISLDVASDRINKIRLARLEAAQETGALTTPNLAPPPSDPTFTVVFRGDVRKIGGNLFQIVEPFGEVVAIAVGDALAELDEAREKLEHTHAGD